MGPRGAGSGGGVEHALGFFLFYSLPRPCRVGPVRAEWSRVGPVTAEWGLGRGWACIAIQLNTLRLGPGYKDKPSGAAWGRFGPSAAE